MRKQVRNTQKTREQGKHASNTHSSKLLLTGLGVVIFGATLCLMIGLNTYLDSVEQQKFHQVADDLNELTKNAGYALDSSGIDWHVNSNCGRAHTVQENGPIDCGSISNLSAPSIDMNGSIELRNKYLAVLANDSKFISSNNKIPTPTLPSTTLYLHRSTNTRCVLRFEFTEPSASEGTGQFIANLSCSSSARQLWFPRNDI